VAAGPARYDELKLGCRPVSARETKCSSGSFQKKKNKRSKCQYISAKKQRESRNHKSRHFHSGHSCRDFFPYRRSPTEKSDL
jgi:hypothetical protein